MYRAEMKRLKALKHLPPDTVIGNTVFDDTDFGQRCLLEDWEDTPVAFDKPEVSDLYRIERLEKEEAYGLLGIRQ